MSWINFKNLTFLSLVIVHTIILLLNYLKLPDSKAVILATLSTALLLSPIIANVILGKVKTLAVNSALILVFLLLIEGLFALRIIQHPVISTWNLTNSKNIESVDFLQEVPFVKFKPNVNVRSQRFRGNDFTYEWQTDALGFKNIKHSDLSDIHFDYIALGDSFTEGMGVSIDNMWTSKVSQKTNVKIYNAAIQGYSASQMKATYLNLKDRLSHDGIIIGALPMIFTREKIFDSLENAKLGTGGIRSIAEASKYAENSFLTELIRALVRVIKKENLPNSKDNRSYIHEIPDSYPDQVLLSGDINWQRYVQNLSELSNFALSSGKEVILIQYPHRHEIYFNAEELGVDDIKEIDYYIELDLLKKSLPKKVKILDMFPYLKEVWSIDKRNIYFVKDGHMNERGQELISAFIVNNIDIP
jgi:hypothetical protein